MKAAKLIFSTMILCAALIPMHASTQTNGEIRYQSNILEFWNGTSWTSTDVADTGVSCSGASPGEIRFNTSPTPDRMEFCNGTNWRRMDATVTGEACTTAGEIELKVPENIVRYCNGGHWVETMVNVAGITCPTGYVVVPADGVYTFSDFCVAKYEMKAEVNAGGSFDADGQGVAAASYKPASVANDRPWVSIDRPTAISECKSLGAGYDLISNSQWQTIARNIENVGWNWDTGSVGGGVGLNFGHHGAAASLAADTDDNNPCLGTGASCSGTTWNLRRRTNKLSNGQVIWDMGGNVFEWVSTHNTFVFNAGTPNAAISQVGPTWGSQSPIGYAKDAFGPAGTWTSFNSGNFGGFGPIVAANVGNGGIKRGGFYGGDGGVFHVHTNPLPSETAVGHGFRCVHNPAPVSTTDLAWDNVVLLVQPKATDNSVIDYSRSNHALTPWQGAALSTAVSDPWGGTRKVIFMDGNDDRLIAPNDSADWDLTGHFTIEYWVYFNLLDASRVTSFIEHYESGAKNHNFGIDNLNNQGLYMNNSAGMMQNQGADNLVATGQWHHFAFQRYGNEFRVYQNGVAALQFNSSSVFTLNAAALAFMGTGNNGNGLHGYLGAIRFTKGVARYSGNFIPPIETFPVQEATALHHWELDETSGTTASDSIGSLDGTLTNGPVWQSGALFDGALDFDGADDYVSVPNTGNVFLTVPFSWSAWVKADTLPSAGATNRYVIEMVHSVSPWEAFGLWVDDAGDLFKFTVNNSAGTAFTVIGNAPLVLNQWYHLAVTVDSGFASKLYVNGVSQGTPQTPGSLYAANGALWIGKAGGANQGWQGLIDDVRFFNRALRQEEIDALTDARLPDIFDFVDVYGAALSTSYQVAATVAGFTGPLTASVTGGDAQVRKNGTGAWGSSVSVDPGDILNLRMTSSGSANTGITATVTLGAAIVDWRVDTTAGAEFHYFVAMSSNVPNGNLGGLSGANATCLANLQANNWLGKSNVYLDSGTVKAWLCDGSTCQNTMASKTYAFAISGAAATGGATFTTDAGGLGPGNATGWNLATTFGTTNIFYWTGRNSTSATQWANTSNASHCSGWTSASSGVSGMRATSNSVSATRWTNATSTCDSSTRRLICMVDYTQGIDNSAEFSFIDTNEATLSTLYEESTIVTGFVGPLTAAVTSGSAEIRANGTGSWVTSGLALNPGDTLNIRMTSSPSVSTTVSSTVTIGSSSATWNLTTDGPSQSYFVIVSNPPSLNMGGLAGADAYCLTQLQSNNWVGKSSAVIQGQLTANNVKAWLCDETTCQNFVPNTGYAIGDAMNPSVGGRVFTSTASGFLPDDGIALQSSNGIVGLTWYLTGRNTSNTSNTGQTCNNWTSTLSTDNRAAAASDVTFYPEKIYKFLAGGCDDPRDMFCMVHQGPVDAPSAFDFPDVYGAATSTVYYAAATLSGFDEYPLTATVSGADAQVRKNGTGTWGSSVSVNPGDILNIRMTSSASANTAVTATVAVNWRTADWRVDTTAGSEFNYFVAMSSNVANGNLGGLSGANATCLANLQANDWMGKSNVSLDSGTVKAWLCDGSTCQNTLANKTYAFALSGTPATGGGTFTTDAGALGPGNATGWNLATTFGTTSVFYWTGRNSTSATQWANTSNASHCSGWTSSSNGVSGMRATSNSVSATRWLNTTSTCDVATRRLICLVDYTQGIDQIPDAFNIPDVQGVAPSTLGESSVAIVGFVNSVTASVTGGDAQIRVNNTGSWVTSGLQVYAGDTLNVRMTSSATLGATVSAVVTVGGVSDTWNLTTGTVVALTSGTSWSVPANWSNTENSIECIGGGAGGGWAGGGNSGGGGGGGGYSKVTNVSLTPSANVSYQIGSGGVGTSGDGTSSYFCNSTSNCASIGGTAVLVGANPGLGNGTGGSTTGAVGTVKFAGGAGTGNAGGDAGGGGGGGAGGPNGIGGAGGVISGLIGGGGGGSGGGSAGASGATPTGGNNSLGSGGGTAGVGAGGAGSAGGGGGGGASGFDGGLGGNGADISPTIGSGGGGGGGGVDGTGRNGGLYGGGGGGSGTRDGNGGVGGAGICVVKYMPAGLDSTPNAFDFVDVYGATLSTSYNVSAVITGFDMAPVTATVSQGDPYASNVVLLIQPDADDVSVVDYGPSSHPVTVANGAGLTTAISDPWGGNRQVIFMDGDDSRVYVPDSNDWYYPGDFTAEAWFYLKSNIAARNFEVFWQPWDGANQQGIWVGNGGDFGMGWESVAPYFRFEQGSDNTASAGSWHHFAITRAGNTFRMFQDGNIVASTTSSTALPNVATIMNIGSDGGAGGWTLDGYIGAARITKGVARYTANFTPPAQAFPTGGVSNAEIRKNGTGAWGSSVAISPGDILNLRMTSSGSSNTAVSATVTVGGVSADWVVDTSPGPDYNYFVAMSANVANGNLGGLSGANATCLADLQANDWMGKSNVALNSSTVKAWLCDGSSCQNTLASKTYAFALSGTPATGGGTFTTDAGALGPGNATGWNLATTFGTTSVFYWTGRNSTSATQWANTSNASHCSGWTSSSNAVSGMRASSNSTTATRWLNATSTCDLATRRLICLVDYTQGVDQQPNAFYFLNTETTASTLVEESTVLSGFVGPVTASVSGNGAEIRANHSGSWVTSGLSVNPGDTINVRMTSSASVGTTLMTTVTVGTGTATWSVTTEEPGCPAGFVRVPNDGVYTTVDFCVMKYEAKAEVNAGGSFDADGTGVTASAYKPSSVPDNIPWRSVDRAVAISECQSLGAGFNLISNAQWQTIARNIEAQNANWTGGTVGNGCLTQGNNGETTCGFDGGNPDVSSTNSRGIQVLSNGRQIHDLAGNVSEWVKDNNATNYGANDNTVSITAATHTTTGTLDDGVARSAKAQFGHAGTYTNVSNSRGLGFANLSAPAGAITRGAGYMGTTTAGIFGVNTAVDSTFSNASWGFRCVSTYTP